MMWQLEIYKHSIKKKEKLKVVNRLKNLDKVKKILDLGCGNGIFSYMLKEDTDFLVSADLSLKNIREAKDLLKSGNFVRCDVNKAPFKGNAFDMVFLLDVLEHVSNDRAVLEEIYRILTPNGRSIMTMPWDSATFSFKRWKKLLGIELLELEQIREGYSFDRLKELTQNQFKIIDVRYYSFFFTEMLEDIINAMRISYQVRAQKPKEIIVSRPELVNTKFFKIYKLVYPILYLISKMDSIFRICGCRGNGIAIKVKKI